LPYNFNSYKDYYGLLDHLIEKYSADSTIIKLLQKLKCRMQEMNCKEEWSVLKYIGPTDDDLTNGNNYYWPTRRNNPVYHGVVDNEEFTAYLYPTVSEYWEILEDPTGMAYNTIFNHGKGALSIEQYASLMDQLANVTDHINITYDFTFGEED
jgi:hypothetical protein